MTVERIRPDAVITFDEDGLYWHLDHVGVHERTTTAIRSLGADAPPLYYVTMPKGVMHELVEAALGARGAPATSTVWGIEPDAFGDQAAAPTFVVDVGDWVGRKLAALRCHRTQMGPHNPFAWLDEAAGAPLARHRAVPARADRHLARKRARTAGAADSCALIRSTFSAARTAAAGSPSRRRSSTRSTATTSSTAFSAVTAAPFRSSTGIPVLHLQPAASKAARASRRGPRGSGAALDVRARRRSRISRAVRRRLQASATSTYRDVVDALGSDVRRRLFSVSLLRSDVRRRRGGGAVGSRGGAARRRTRGRRVRRLGTSHAHARRACRRRRRFSPICISRRCGSPAASPRPAARRCAATATRRCRSRAARSATRCAPTRSCTSGRSVSSSRRCCGLTDTGDTRTAVVINHTHNQLTWSPSHGQALPPSGYRDLFETIEPRLFGEADLLADVVSGGPLDLARRDDQTALDADPALTLVASRDPRRVRAPSARAGQARRAASSGSIRCTRRGRKAAASGCSSTSPPTTTSRSTAPAGDTCRARPRRRRGDARAAARRERRRPAGGSRRGAG